MMLLKAPRQILREIEREGGDIDRIQARLKRELARLRTQLEKELRNFLSDKRNVSKGDRLSLATAVKTVRELDRMLIDAGFPEFLDSRTEAFGELTRSSLKYFKNLGQAYKLSDVSLDAFDAYIRLTEATLVTEIQARLLSPIKTALFQSSFGSLSRDEALSYVSTIADNIPLSRVEQTLDWAFESFQRAVTAETADRLGLEIFQYVGPDDALTSPQCQAMLSVNTHGAEGMLFRDEITTDLHEDLVYDPLINGGHPNCRHKWVPVSTEYAESQGFRLQ